VTAGGVACLATLVAVLAGCESPADEGEAPFSFVGTWNYEATQTAPFATLAGALSITAQTGRDFSGSLDVIETDGSGSRPRNGPVSGRVLDSITVDFDAFLDVTARRHFGIVRGDSVQGNWVEGAGGPAGSFTGERVAP
jgi:hypothetical protein